MKIVVVGPVYPYRGGIAHFTTGLCQALRETGDEVLSLSFQRQYPGWLYPGSSDKEPGAQKEPSQAAYVLDPLYIWTWRRAMAQIIQFQPDLVIIQWWTTFWGLAFYYLGAALKKRGIPCVFLIHNVFPHEKRFLDVWLSRRVLANAAGYITLSPKESKRLKELFPAATIYPAHLPVTRVADPQLDRDTLRKEMGLSTQQKVLLFFGFVRPYKGLDVLLEALAELAKEKHTPRLLVVGEFWGNFEAYQKKIAALSLGGQVTLENRYVPNEEIGRFYRAADALVAPYLAGTQSGTLRMAMACGLPILASDQIAGDLPVDTYPVYVHRAGDRADLMGSIQKFLNQETLVQRTPADYNDWQEFQSLLAKIRVDLCGE